MRATEITEDKQLQAIAIIPARYSSTRLPGKPLIDIAGKPLIQRVWEAVCRSRLLRRVVIATDDERIAELCMEIGAECVMTPAYLPSGTDRIEYAYRTLEDTVDIILNVQGDEPLIKSEVIDDLIDKFSRSECHAATLIRKVTDKSDLDNPSVVKVVINRDHQALYFSRSAIPFSRNYEKTDWTRKHIYWKHIGIYAYKEQTLQTFVRLPVSELEEIESLEQLRLLQNNIPIYCVETDINLVGVDTPQDVKEVEKMLSSV